MCGLLTLLIPQEVGASKMEVGERRGEGAMYKFHFDFHESLLHKRAALALFRGDLCGKITNTPRKQKLK